MDARDFVEISRTIAGDKQINNCNVQIGPIKLTITTTKDVMMDLEIGNNTDIFYPWFLTLVRTFPADGGPVIDHDPEHHYANLGTFEELWDLVERLRRGSAELTDGGWISLQPHQITKAKGG